MNQEKETREHEALRILKDHFNSKNRYPLEEKIRIAQLIIDDGLKEDKQDFSKQKKLEF
jgi:hypothetical protein